MTGELCPVQSSDAHAYWLELSPGEAGTWGGHVDLRCGSCGVGFGEAVYRHWGLGDNVWQASGWASTMLRANLVPGGIDAQTGLPLFQETNRSRLRGKTPGRGRDRGLAVPDDLPVGSPQKAVLRWRHDARCDARQLLVLPDPWIGSATTERVDFSRNLHPAARLRLLGRAFFARHNAPKS
jgi:hypothetical protein